ncbi:MAG: phenylalanine--tRNA ligase subunit beta [Rhodocyclaceae bacterium]|nr:phenylalanine--tRNA ligase subunit beta [Rhodocyclaceae bacterium]
MQFSESWLRTFVNPSLSTEALCHLLTMAGLEVEDENEGLITLKLTPNRADCLSILGIAREVAALTGSFLVSPSVDAIPAVIDDHRAVTLDVPQSCPRYCGRIVRGISPTAKTPDWMQQRLEQCGSRAISPVVDITNYVMLELGQPLHAFDNAKLSGTLHVRAAKPEETLRLLNGEVVELSSHHLLIADEAQALALAGIMGGISSAVDENTTDLFLESAFFAPKAIAGKARALGFSTDASYRFERGVDFELPRWALERATRLIVDICGGHAGPIIETVSTANLPIRQPVRLRTGRVADVLGVDIPLNRIEALLQTLGGNLKQQDDGFVITPPACRFDIEIEEDLIEEIARLYGYNNIPARPPRANLSMLPLPENVRTPLHIKQFLAGRGYQEVVTYSFVEAAWETDFAGNTDPLRLANPIASQMSVMRSTLLGGLVNVLVTNRNRQTPQVRIFEMGRSFLTIEAQPQRLAGLWAGSALPEQWGINPTRDVDFFDIKGDLEALFSPHSLHFEKMIHPALHPGRAARILFDGRDIGFVGALHPQLVQKYELGMAPVVFEVDRDVLLSISVPAYREVSRQPAVIRDLALVVSQNQNVEPLQAALRAAAPPVVVDISLFDVYQGKGLADGQKSLAFRVVMRDTERTLTDVEVEKTVALLVDAAVHYCGAVLRG